MITAEDCEREIRELHEFFVEYYAGGRDDFGRLERALGDGFELVHPSGEKTSREEVLDSIRDTYDTYEPGLSTSRSATSNRSRSTTLIQRENPALPVSEECSDTLSEPRNEQGGSKSRKLW